MDLVSSVLGGITSAVQGGWNWLTGTIEERGKAKGEAEAYKKQLEDMQKMQVAGGKSDGNNKTWIYLAIGGIALVALIFIMKK